jgi:hypothetical protein
MQFFTEHATIVGGRSDCDGFLMPFNALTTQLAFFLLTSPALVRPRRPGADTKRSQHDFHCERTKNESHYAYQNGRALSTDHAQNRIRKKQEKIGQKEYHKKNNTGFAKP